LNDSLTLATLALVVITLGLVIATLWQVRLNRRSLDLSIRPLLAETDPVVEGPNVEDVQFGPPGRTSLRVRLGELALNEDGTNISLPFRNIGAGVAVITGATTDPEVEGSVVVARKFVPVGEHVRVNVSVQRPESTLPVPQTGHWWAMKPFAILIQYTDAEGRQPLVSRAEFRQAATQGPWVAKISVFKKGKKRPFAVGESTV